MEQLPNIVLIGMPGVGKSTLGVVLAKIMNYQFVDADLLIQQACGSTLQTVIDTQGTQAFIALESSVLCGIHPETPTVIATGGSAIYSPAAMDHLRTLGPVVYLQVSCEELKTRLLDFEDRGVVMQEGISSNLEQLFAERMPLYETYAQVTVNVEGLSITAAARKVAAALKGACEQ
ncbi:MAG: shikimate kinase [Coriobacteriia bacterium]|nr:shikimate kinase [Coriobacteriia bacterium]